MRIALGVSYAGGEPMISKGDQCAIDGTDLRPGKALRLHGVSEILLRRAQSSGFAFDLEKQYPAFGKHDQVGKAGMHAHADKDCLAGFTAPVSRCDLIDGMMHDCVPGQDKPQSLHDGALGIGLGGFTPSHAAPPFGAVLAVSGGRSLNRRIMPSASVRSLGSGLWAQIT